MELAMIIVGKELASAAMISLPMMARCRSDDLGSD